MIAEIVSRELQDPLPMSRGLFLNGPPMLLWKFCNLYIWFTWLDSTRWHKHRLNYTGSTRKMIMQLVVEPKLSLQYTVHNSEWANLLRRRQGSILVDVVLESSDLAKCHNRKYICAFNIWRSRRNRNSPKPRVIFTTNSSREPNQASCCYVDTSKVSMIAAKVEWKLASTSTRVSMIAAR